MSLNISQQTEIVFSSGKKIVFTSEEVKELCQEIAVISDLRLYAWTEYAPDYTHGLAVAIASSGEEAREMIMERGNNDSRGLEYNPVIHNLSEKVAYTVRGGG